MSDPTFPAVPMLLDRLHRARSTRTIDAYNADLADFARWQGRGREQAVGLLLAGGPDNARRTALTFAAYLRRQERAQATIERRLSTLAVLVAEAEEAGLIDWRLAIRDWRAASHDADDWTTGKDVAYLLPRGPEEIHRLDVQHYALAVQLGSQYQVRHYLAPVGDNLRWVLDVGAGTGQWGYDVSREHSGALVVGIDLVRPKPGAPARYRAVRGNVLQGLPFSEASFDFVHQRFLFSGVPVAAWPAEVAELARVSRGGGWVELAEGMTCFERMGPATERLTEMLHQVNSRVGLDTESVVCRSLGQFLIAAGLEQVEDRWIELPIGEWAGTVGSLMASDARAFFTRLSGRFADLGVPAGESADLVRAAREEWEQYQTRYWVGVAWGKKPA